MKCNPYSVKWLEDSDRENLNRETLEKQFQIVKRETNTSTVCQFGDLSIAKMKVSQFQGEKKTDDESIVLLDQGTIEHPLNYFYNHSPFPPSFHRCGRDAVPGPEVPIRILEKRLAANDDEDKGELQKELDKMLQGRKSLVKITTGKSTFIICKLFYQFWYVHHFLSVLNILDHFVTLK